MSQRLERGERLLLIGAVTVLVAISLLSGLLGTLDEEDPIEQVASTYRTGPGGAKAAWLLLGELGYRLERWERPPARLPVDSTAAATLLVLADPTSPATEEESLSVARFVEAGGTLLVTGVDGRLAPGLVSDARPFWLDSAVTCERRAVTAVSARAATLSIRRAAAATTLPDGASVLYAHGDDPVVARWPLGRGQVFWWAGSTPLGNRGIADQRHLALLFDTLGPPGARRVLWDEYFHDVRGGLAGYLGRTPLPWVLAQLLALCGLVVFTWSRRLGPTRVPLEESRVSMLEFVDAVGGLYARAGATATAVRLEHEALRRRLGARLGLAPGAPGAALAEAARRRLGHGGDPLADALARAERLQDGRPTPAEALGMVRELDGWQRRLDTAGGGAGAGLHGRTT
jgi:hypothetical protein